MGEWVHAETPLTLKQSTDDSVLTIDEVLDYLQLNLRTVRGLIRTRSIPAVRVGREWRFRKPDLDAWLDARKTAAAAAAGRRRVLLVDDEDSIRTLLSRMLASVYDVDDAASGASALEKLRRPGVSYDLLISDLNMPGMDGLALIREVRSFDAKLPVLIITGFSTESSAIEAVNLGVAGYLTKPFGGSQMLAAAARALGVPAA